MTEVKMKYVVALRTKQGEQNAFSTLASDVAKVTAARWVVPTPSDPDPQSGRPLRVDEIVNVMGRRAAEASKLRSAYLDPQNLLPFVQPGVRADALARMFRLGRDLGATLTAVVPLSELLKDGATDFKAVLAEKAGSKIALLVRSDQINGSVSAKLLAAIGQLGIQPSHCDIFADFCEADLTDIGSSAKVVERALTQIADVAPWNSVIFQGSNYPHTIPAKDGGEFRTLRTEWLIWRAIASADPSFTSRFIFGDCASDHGDFLKSSKGRSKAVAHIRYCTSDSWLTVRGHADDKQDVQMRRVCSRLMASGHYAGREWSQGDEYVHLVAKGIIKPSSPSRWREANVNRHISQVARDLAPIAGFKVEPAVSYGEDAEPPLL